jgi:TatD DNase family protein
MPDFIDIGLNLTHRQFNPDRAEVLARAQSGGVSRMILTGTSVTGSHDALELARQHPGVLWSTAGVHPHGGKDWSDAAARALDGLARGSTTVRAIGECGLDFERNISPRAEQERAFSAQLELAVNLGLPVFLHERAAHARFLAILGRFRARLVGAVVHCFTGSAAELDAYLGLDCHLGITGWICDERRGRHLLDLMPKIPLDRLMLETDAPFLTPRDLEPGPSRGRNEPAFLPHIAARVAQARGMDLASLAAATTATATAFFGLPARA